MAERFQKAWETGIPVIGCDEERMALLSAETPNFTEIVDILFQGEIPYPDDKYFDRRIGRGDIHNFGGLGTDDKQVVIILTPTHIRLGCAFMLSAQPETDGTIFVGDVPSDALAARMKFPQPIENPEAINVDSPYTVTNLFHSENKELQPPDDPVMAKTVTERFDETVQHNFAGRFSTTTISPEPKYEEYMKANPQNWELNPVSRKIRYAFYNAHALAQGKKGKEVDMGFSLHVKNNRGFIGRLGTNNTGYTYVGRAQRRADERAYKAGLIPVAGYIRDQLSPEDQARTVECPSRIKIFRRALGTRSVFLLRGENVRLTPPSDPQSARQSDSSPDMSAG
jgi:hypothetical protein